VSENGWPSQEDAARGSLAQAEGDFLRLHHEMKKWEPTPKGKPIRYVAVCVKCGMFATVTVRQWHAVPFAGPALQFRCPKA
jgi:hypothetical protein